MILKRFRSSKVIDVNLEFFNIKERPYDSSMFDAVVGLYEILNSNIYAVFSDGGRNFLFLKDQLIEITKLLSIEANVNWSKNELSSFKVWDDHSLLAEVEYVNEHEGILMPFEMIENWEEVNFGNELSSLINKVRENPDLILFRNERQANL